MPVIELTDENAWLRIQNKRLVEDTPKRTSQCRGRTNYHQYVDYIKDADGATLGNIRSITMSGAGARIVGCKANLTILEKSACRYYTYRIADALLAMYDWQLAPSGRRHRLTQEKRALVRRAVDSPRR